MLFISMFQVTFQWFLFVIIFHFSLSIWHYLKNILMRDVPFLCFVSPATDHIPPIWGSFRCYWRAWRRAWRTLRHTCKITWRAIECALQSQWTKIAAVIIRIRFLCVIWKEQQYLRSIMSSSITWLSFKSKGSGLVGRPRKVPCSHCKESIAHMQRCWLEWLIILNFKLHLFPFLLVIEV